MKTELETAEEQKQLPEAANAGAVSIEQERAIAEARGQIQLAKMFPRSMAKATEDLIEACKSPQFAGAAFYSVPNRGSGPSIRFAEEVARVYGNFEYGHRELSRSNGKSEIEVFAWDKENNNVSKRQITVMHIVDTKRGPKILKDQADIDNKVANVASKQMRGRILALLPKALVQLGIEECQKTLAGNNGESIASRIGKMISAFANQGVSTKHISEYLGKSVDDANADDLTNLVGVFNAIKGGAKVSDYFGNKEQEPDEKPAIGGGESSGGGLAGAAKQAEKDGEKPKVAGDKPKKEEPKGEEPAAAASQGDDQPPVPDEAPPGTEEDFDKF